MISKSFSIPAPAIVSLSTRRNWFDFDGITGKTPAGLAFAGANGTYFDSAGVLQDAVANTPRFDYHPATLASRGVLIEPARTNSIRNSTMQGAAAGTPGTLPTNWVVSASGLTRTIVGAGVEDGVPYIDVRLAGTTGATADNMLPESTTAVAVASGETWTQSAFVRLVGGSLANISAVIMRTLGYNSTPAVQETQPNQDITSLLGGASLRVCRAAKSYTFVNGATVTGVPFLTITHSSGVVVDLTLRIGLWQFEKGTYATSPIKTTSAAVTRAADLPTGAIGVNAPFYTAFECELAATAAGVLASVHGVGAANAASQIGVGAGPAWAVSTKDAGVEQGPLAPAGTPATGTIYRIAHAVDTNNLRACVNGGTVVQDTGASVPVPTNIRFGADGDGANQSAFWLRRARVLKGSPTNSAMQDF